MIVEAMWGYPSKYPPMVYRENWNNISGLFYSVSLLSDISQNLLKKVFVNTWFNI